MTNLRPSGRPFHRAVTFGRFNLLHNGHVTLFEEMGLVADYLTIGISTNERNLPVPLREELIKIACNDFGLAFSVVPASNPFELFKHVAGLGNSDVTVVLGDDQFQLGQAALKHYTWQPHYISRLTSSTAVRMHLDREEWDILAELTPPGLLPDLINLRKLELTRNNA